MAQDTQDSLDDLSALVSDTLSLLGPASEDTSPSYEINLQDSPSKASQPVRGPLDPLIASPHMDLAVSENIDLSSPTAALSPSAVAASAASARVPEIGALASPSTSPLASPGHSHPGGGPAVVVRVKDPERIDAVSALGLKVQHWVYPLLVDSTLPGFLATGLEVKRRFSDFDVLHKLLRVENRGCFIPPLPQKTLIENNSEEFLRLRRADLQAFLRSLVAHPVLQQSEVLKVFLLQLGDLARNPAWLTLSATHAPKRLGLQGTDDSAASTSAASAGNAAFANLNTWVSWVKHSAAPLFQPPKRELPPGEDELLQMKELLQDLERLLQLAVHSARTLCHDMEKVALDFREFGINMGMLSKYEEAVGTKLGQYTPEGHSASNRAANFTKFSASHARQHSVWKSAALKAASNLVVLHDYYILIPEAVRALEEREAALEQVFLVQEELAAKQQQLEATPEAQDRRIAQLTQQIASLREQLRISQEQYTLVKDRNRSELARLGLKREADFRQMMSVFASNQAQLVQQSADLWASLASQFAAPTTDAA